VKITGTSLSLKIDPVPYHCFQRRTAARRLVQISLNEIHALEAVEFGAAAVILAEREQRCLRDRFIKRTKL
jgi:hypothetical protein